MPRACLSLNFVRLLVTRGLVGCALIGCALIGCALTGCASKSPSENCSVNAPASCPDPTLSYAAGVGATLTANCSPCHAPGGVEASVLLSNYAQVSKQLTSVAGQLETCTMPPGGAPPLSATDRQTILDWIVCGAPP